MTIGNRIRSVRRDKKLSQPELAKLAKVTQSTISDLENDKKSTSAENMEAIAQALGTSSTYLLTGRSPSFNIAEHAKNIKHDVDEKLRTVSNLSGMTLVTEDLVSIKYYSDIPMSCGFGSIGDILDQATEELTISYSGLRERHIYPAMCVAFPAVGDSMLPTIKDKDTVFVDLERKSIRDGKVFAICHGGLFKFKRLYNLPLGGVRIVSDNAAEFPEERLTAQDIQEQQFEVIGWAWSWQSMEYW